MAQNNNAEAKQRILKHAQNITNLVTNTSDDLYTGIKNVSRGYLEAIKYYKSLRNAFETNVLSQGGEQEKQAFTTWFKQNTSAKTAKVFSDATTRAFNNLFQNKDTHGFNNDLIYAMMVDLVMSDSSDAEKKAHLEQIKSNADQRIALAQKYEEMTKQGLNLSAKKGQTFLGDEVKRLIASQRNFGNQTLEADTVNFDMADLMSQVINPAYKNLTIAYTADSNGQQDISVNAHLSNYVTAQGFWFEAMVYDAVSNAFSQIMKVEHTGQKNKQEDIVLSINSATDKLQELFVRGKRNAVVGVSDFATIGKKKKLNLEQAKEYMKLQETFGIQVKNTQLLGSLQKSTNRNMAMMKKFQRISNQSDLLSEFRTSVPLDKQQKLYIQNEAVLDDASYEFRIAQAIRYLSASHRIIATMGYLNVLYYDRSGPMWTADLITKLHEQQHYLSFQAGLDSAPTQFGAAVGFRRFIFE